VRERVLEEIRRGTYLIDTTGARVGQINGLSVSQVGHLAFGRPTRITARARLGKGEVVDIEREVELGGPIHSKGVLILAGFLGARYAKDHPLSLGATLVFEQSYGGVEGDSASAAELCALLSAIADVPIRQALAVTGSVNQYGELQAVGGLDEKVDARLGSLSGGQRRRVDLALGIIGRPELLFLDEPTTGFDPSARRRSWDLIEALGDDGTTVLLTTHYLDEAEHLADRVGVLSKGRMIAEGSPDQLIGQVSGTVISFMLPDTLVVDDTRRAIADLLGVEVRVSGRLVEVNVESPTAAVHRLTGWALDDGHELEALSVTRVSLEDVYLALTDRADHEEQGHE